MAEPEKTLEQYVYASYDLSIGPNDLSTSVSLVTLSYERGKHHDR